jgi:hypothetical protein
MRKPMLKPMMAASQSSIGLSGAEHGQHSHTGHDGNPE